LKARPTWYREKALSSDVTRQIRAGFYALSTHIDHQVRSVIGLLKEQGILDNTVLMFTSDHGNMLGNHGLYNVGLFYESCAKVPMVLVPTPAQVEPTGPGRVDDRLVAHADIMPTLLDMCDIPVPPSVEGLSMVGDRTRDHLYGEFGEDSTSSRMIVDGHHKLIYYPVGDRSQLFDLRTDPNEMHDVASEPTYSQVKAHMLALLLDNLYGTDLEWIENGKLVGLPDMQRTRAYDYSPTFGNARGYRIR
jgi:arylsulfatase A-like enzyme